MGRPIAGVDLGGTSIKVALSDKPGDVLLRRSVATDSHEGPEKVVERIGKLLAQLAMDYGRPLASVGIGVPGLVDVQTGVTRFLPNLETQWRDIPVGEMLSSRLSCPVRLLNDVRTATLAELRFGHGRQNPDVTMAFFSLGTGVGGGVVVDGRLRLGALGAAGELGHQTILAEGPRCGCGNRGCLETLSSGTAIAAEGIRLMRMGLAPALHRIVKGDANRVSVLEMAAAAEADPSIHEAIVTAARYLGIAAANVVTILHPDIIVLGGGVAEVGALLTDTVQAVITERVGMFPSDTVRVERSQLGDTAGVMGALALAQDQLSN